LGKGLQEKKKGGQETAREEAGEFFSVDAGGSLGVGLVDKMAAGQGNFEFEQGRRKSGEDEHGKISGLCG
jgi:hypothetical protein